MTIEPTAPVGSQWVCDVSACCNTITPGVLDALAAALGRTEEV